MLEVGVTPLSYQNGLLVSDGRVSCKNPTLLFLHGHLNHLFGVLATLLLLEVLFSRRDTLSLESRVHGETRFAISRVR